MSMTKRWIDQQAAVAGMEPDGWLADRQRDQQAFASYWEDAGLCAACGWQGVPETIRSGDEAVDVCPNCNSVETFHCHQEADDCRQEADYDEA